MHGRPDSFCGGSNSRGAECESPIAVLPSLGRKGEGGGGGVLFVGWFVG